MSPIPEFTFTQCISEQHFKTKPGSAECKTIVFKPQEVTIKKLLDYATHGGVFSPTCKSASIDGSFPITAKTKESFVSASTLFYDFDKMDVPMSDFVIGLKYKPSFAYTSYRNGVDGFRYRLGYVFRHPITGNQNYRELYCAVCTATGFPIETQTTGGLDKRNEAQCYFGTRTDADTYISGYNYSQQEFDEYRSSEQTHAFFPEEKSASESCSKPRTAVRINPEFLKDFKALSSLDFESKYSSQYGRNYVTATSTPLILDESQMFYTFPENYTAVLHSWKGRQIRRWDIGEDRKNKIFWTAQIMLHNNPNLTIENLLYNLRRERDLFYVNTDNKVNNEYLISVAQRSMTKRYTPNQTRHGKFRINPEFWGELGLSHHAAANCVRGYFNAQVVKQYINPFLGIKENLEILHEHGVSVREGKLISESTLKRMVTKGLIQINTNHGHLPTPDSIGCTEDVTIRDKPLVKGILHLIQTDGNMTQKAIADTLEVDVRTIKRYFKELEGTVIRREGNNRSGRWVVLEDS